MNGLYEAIKNSYNLITWCIEKTYSGIATVVNYSLSLLKTVDTQIQTIEPESKPKVMSIEDYLEKSKPLRDFKQLIESSEIGNDLEVAITTFKKLDVKLWSDIPVTEIFKENGFYKRNDFEHAIWFEDISDYILFFYFNNFGHFLGSILIFLFLTLVTLVPILLTVAFFTFCERKILASVQRRRGPNVVGFWGVLQAIADGLKLVLKEIIIPSRSNMFFFIFAPIWVLAISFSGWALIPFSYNNFYVDFDFGVLYLLAISSLGVYGIVIAGWSSNSRYAFLGGLRSVAQLISYEVSLGLIILPIILLSNSLNFIEIVSMQEKTIWFCLPFLPLTIIFFITILAETNRTPFDLPEAEAELVAGFNVEYSSTLFALFFLGEYSSILLMSATMSILFFGGWLPIGSFFGFSGFWLILKTIIVCIFFVLIRGALPRYRYDQLMSIGWKIILPITLSFFYFVSSIFVGFDSLPLNVSVLVEYFHTEIFNANQIQDRKIYAFFKLYENMKRVGADKDELALEYLSSIFSIYPEYAEKLRFDYVRNLPEFKELVDEHLEQCYSEHERSLPETRLLAEKFVMKQGFFIEETSRFAKGYFFFKREAFC